MMSLETSWPNKTFIGQLAGAVKYTNCISAEGQDSTNKCSGYDIKPFDGKAPVMELWGIWSTPSLLLLPGPLWSDSTW